MLRHTAICQRANNNEIFLNQKVNVKGLPIDPMLPGDRVYLYCFKRHAYSVQLAMPEKCSNTEFFLVRIFPHSDQKKLLIWTFLDKNFNSNISPVNVIVERVFGILKVRWRGLLTILDAKECFKCVYRIFCFA